MTTLPTRCSWPWLVALAFILPCAAPPPARAQAPKRTPVFFVPLTLPKAMARQELTLRRVLTARLLATGRFTAAVSAETERAMQECVRQVNKDANAEQCWVRIGQGQGADMMVTGDVLGDKRSCDLTVQLTILETRVSPVMHVKHLAPCGLAELRSELGAAALTLAGQAAPGGPAATTPSAGAPTRLALPPPPTDAAATPTTGGAAPPPPAAAVASLSVTGSPKGARVDVSGPRGFNAGKPLATALPLFPPQTVPAGEYTVRVSAPQHDTFEEKRLIPALGTWALEVKLEPSTATLVVSGEPAGASTTIGCGPGFAQRPFNLPAGQAAFGLGAQGFVFQVPKGRCVVRASFVGWQDFEQEVELAGGERKALHVELAQQPKGVVAGKHGITWIRLPGGRFQMGSNEGDSDEKPVHEVRVGAFSLMKSEITVAMYKACVAAGKCSAPHFDDGTCYVYDGSSWKKGLLPQSLRSDEHPVVCIDWEQARGFCSWAGGRLPSEAEWEYAARSGGREVTYPWGNETASCSRAVMDDGGKGCGRSSTWPVCSKTAGSSAQGICDLAGNVWEWVEDWFHSSYEGAPQDGTTWTQGDSIRVFRGGSWRYRAAYLRAANRGWNVPGYRCDLLGGRCARSE